MPDDLRDFRSDSDPWQLLDEPVAYVAFLAVIALGVILLRLT